MEDDKIQHPDAKGINPFVKATGPIQQCTLALFEALAGDGGLGGTFNRCSGLSPIGFILETDYKSQPTTAQTLDV